MRTNTKQAAAILDHLFTDRGIRSCALTAGAEYGNVRKTLRKSIGAATDVSRLRSAIKVAVAGDFGTFNNCVELLNIDESLLNAIRDRIDVKIARGSSGDGARAFAKEDVRATLIEIRTAVLSTADKRIPLLLLQSLLARTNPRDWPEPSQVSEAMSDDFEL